MELNEYQNKILEFFKEGNSLNMAYVAMNLSSEVGEFNGHLAKMIRAGHANVRDNQFVVNLGDDANGVCHEMKLVAHEIGDVICMGAAACELLNLSLEDVCRMNLEKLNERRNNGTIIGKGDER